MTSNNANNGAESADIDPIYQNLDWYVYPDSTARAKLLMMLRFKRNALHGIEIR